MHDEWEEKHGELWSYDFTRKKASGGGRAQCVDARVLRRGSSTAWGDGVEGMFACRKCVEADRPCCTFSEGEFWLLLPNEGDRKWAVEEDGEVWELRCWLNVK